MVRGVSQLNRKKTSRREKGQMAVEALIILVLLVGVFTLVSREFKKNQWIENFVSQPWVKLSSLLQSGVWTSGSNSSQPVSMEFHPLQKNRNRSLSGDP